MILQETPPGVLRVVLQPDHAAQCARIAERWRRPAAIPQPVWPRFLAAVRRHDDGWASVERHAPIDAAGRPYSFRNLPTHLHHDLVINGIETAARDDAYAGLLVALHFRWLATRHPKPNLSAEDVQRFVDDVDKRVEAFLNALRREGDATRQACEPANLDAARNLLSAIDGLSLFLNGGIPVSDWPSPLAFGDTASPLTIRRDDHDQAAGLRLAPWPFAGGAFTAPVTVRRLPRTTFPSAPAFAAALAEAETLETPHRLAPLE